MKKIFVWLGFLYKRHMKKISLYAVLLIMAVSCFSIKYVADNFKVTIKFGVVNLDDGNMSERIENELYGHGGLIVFEKYESRDELVRGVQSGDVYGGYVLREEFSRKILEGDDGNIIESLTTPNNVISGISNVLFFSFVMNELSYEELVSDTLDTGLFKMLTEDEVREELRRYFDVNISNGSTFSVDYENEPEDYEGKFATIDIYDYISPVIAGIVGLMIFIGGMSGTISVYDDRKNGSLVLLRPHMRQLVEVMETFIPVTVITAVGLVILFATGMETGAAAAVKYILYGLLVTVYCGILRIAIRKKEVFVSLIPVLALVSVVFCPVFTNIASMSPGMSNIGKIVPLYWLYNF